MHRTALKLIVLAAGSVAALSGPSQAGGFRFCEDCPGGLQYYGDKPELRGPDLRIGGHAEWPSTRGKSKRAAEEPRHRAKSRSELHEAVRQKRAAIARAAAAREAEKERARRLAVQRTKDSRLARERAAQEKAKSKAASTVIEVKAIRPAPTHAATAPAVATPVSMTRADTSQAEAQRTRDAGTRVTGTTGPDAQARQTEKAEALLRQLMGKDLTSTGDDQAPPVR